MSPGSLAAPGRAGIGLLLVLGAPLLAQGPPAVLEMAGSGLEIEAIWEPVTDTAYRLESRFPFIARLTPAADRAMHGIDRFRPFLPPGPVSPGDSWRISVAEVLPLLAQFHPGATAELHHGSSPEIAAPGGWACLRALGEAVAEIRFRIHGEFLIAGGDHPHADSWFTPAQFRGRLQLDRKTQSLLGFDLHVPAQGANVDLNIRSGGAVLADIGRIPRMELAGGSWIEIDAGIPQIRESEALHILERKFYPFAASGWQPDLASAVAQSRAIGRPLHVVALFGSLLDESC